MGRLLVLGLVVVVGACRPTTMSGGIKVYEDRWRDTTRELAFRADVDFGVCSSREFTLLERHKSYPVRVGVRGCGSAGVYEKRWGAMVSRHKAAAWMLVTWSVPTALTAK